jgi:hypothetical protein
MVRHSKQAWDLIAGGVALLLLMFGAVSTGVHDFVMACQTGREMKWEEWPAVMNVAIGLALAAGLIVAGVFGRTWRARRRSQT